MLRLAICDDMPDFSNHTKHLIERWNVDNLVIEVFDNGDSLIAAHVANPFDIILLDIIMPLLNGIDTAAEIRKSDKTVKIIFLTSSSEFAIDSYSVKATNYLLKPVVAERLYQCLDECLEDIRVSSKAISVKNTTSIHRVELEQIEYLEAQGKHVLFSLVNGDTILSTDPFYICENRLPLEDGFFKCHRSYIVNIYKIDTYTSKELKMRSGYRIPISRSVQKDFETVYFNLMFGRAGDY